MHDIIREFGYLTLGSRLKRLGEQLQGDVTRYAQALGLPVPAGLFPILAALSDDGPLTINALAATLGVSQPGVTRGVARLAELEMVEVTRVHRDLRHKTVALTDAGHDVVARARRDLWPAVEQAVRALCAPLDGPLLAQLTAIEDGLAACALDERARALHATGAAGAAR